MIGKLISGLVGFFGATLLFWLGLAYDRTPVGWPNVPVHCCVLVNFTLHAPDIGALTAAKQQLAAYQAAELAAIARAKAVEAQDAQISAAAATHDQAAQAAIVTRYRTIIKEIPSVLTPQIDARFPLPVGFVRLHDAAALGLDVSAVPDAAGRPDDAASEVDASRAAAVIVGNYGSCREDQQRLADLQSWTSAVVASHAGK